MPLYEYVCTPCDHKFEKLRPMSQVGEDASCPQCDSPSPRALSVFATFVSETEGDWSPSMAGGGCGGCGPGGCACSV